MSFGRRAGAGPFAVLTAFAATLTLVTPAEAAVHDCRVSRERAVCAYVTGIDAPGCACAPTPDTAKPTCRTAS
ncbi:hypothetical protein ACIBAG_20125 [Streptomyces sp. NPDC051243]|uniref:hypothetical protein n=1 Tax=Streptomyces sp. NPDC051243 TaxID=3365646 RepID=UPI003794E023